MIHPCHKANHGLTISHLCIFSCSVSIQFRVQIGCFNLFQRMPELSPLDFNTPQHAWNKFKQIQVQTCLKLKPFKPISRSWTYQDIFQYELLQSTPPRPQPPTKKTAIFECSTYITKIKMQTFPRQETNDSSETHHIWCDFFRPREVIMQRDSSCHYAGPKWVNWMIAFCLTPIETQYLLAFGILPSGNSNKFNIPIRKSNIYMYIYFAGICKTYSWKIHDHIK